MVAEKVVTENLYNPLVFANKTLRDLLESRDGARLDHSHGLALSRAAAACTMALGTLQHIDFSW